MKVKNIIFTANFRLCIIWLTLLTILNGCSIPLLIANADNLNIRETEISAVPFIPQTGINCGPASVAMLLEFNGVKVPLEQLISELIIPDKQGSLQLEVKASLRKYGLLPYQISPNLNDLIQEINANHPVIVMLDSSENSDGTTWHFAVVVGYSALHDQMILRSGQQRRLFMSVKSFYKNWAKADYWGMLGLAPGELPSIANQTTLLHEIAAMESLQHTSSAQKAYEAALIRWPELRVAKFGRANTLFAQRKYAEAENQYAEIIKQHPDWQPAYTNSVYSLINLQCEQLVGTRIKELASLFNLPQEVSRLRALVADHIEPNASCQLTEANKSSPPAIQ